MKYGGKNLIAAGLRFACTGCGSCCRGRGWVFVDDAEIALLAHARGIPVARFREAFTRTAEGRTSLVDGPGGDCVFLSGGRCAVYECRPRQCRSWPFWFRNVRSPQAWEEAGRACPGVNEGPLHPEEEILDWLEGREPGGQRSR